MSRVESKMSRVKGSMSRVEGNFEKYIKIKFKKINKNKRIVYMK